MGCPLDSHDCTDALELVEAEAEAEDYISCWRCRQHVVGPMYQCLDCPYYSHRKCFELEKVLENHELHPQHPLTLCRVQDLPQSQHGYYVHNITGCFGCGKSYTSGSFFGYHCKTCDPFDIALEIKCALPNLAFNHPTHGHPLEFYYFNKSNQGCNRKPSGEQKVSVWLESSEVEKRCSACGMRLLGPTFGCPGCEFWLHKSCSQLQPEIANQPFHSNHTLRLSSRSPFPQTYRCRACGLKIIHGFTYQCDQCEFGVHSYCAFSYCPALKHDQINGPNAHQHDLTFFANTTNIYICKACGGHCGGTPIYRCVECDFNLHISCLQFPPTVRHKSHECTLEFISNDVFLDSMDTQCSVCPRKIDLNMGFYHCSRKCNYSLHIECATEIEADKGMQVKVKDSKVHGRSWIMEPAMEEELLVKCKEKYSKNEMNPVNLKEFLYKELKASAEKKEKEVPKLKEEVEKDTAMLKLLTRELEELKETLKQLSSSGAT